MTRPVCNVRRRFAARSAAAGSLLLAGLFLGACSTTSLSDLPFVGMPENIPPRPATPAAYLPVHDMPAPRTEPVLSPEEQARIEKELAAARDRQNAKQNSQRTTD